MLLVGPDIYPISGYYLVFEKTFESMLVQYWPTSQSGLQHSSSINKRVIVIVYALKKKYATDIVKRTEMCVYIYKLF